MSVNNLTTAEPSSNSRRQTQDKKSVVCPQCGKENAFDAVFCENPECHKALGEFKYLLEEMRAQEGWFDRMADRIADFIGKPHFIIVHVIWFSLWVGINTGALMIARKFDEYPFSLLSFILALEAIFITGFLLISQNRQGDFFDKRAELDYEVNVHTFREIHEIKSLLEGVAERLNTLEANHRR